MKQIIKQITKQISLTFVLCQIVSLSLFSFASLSFAQDADGILNHNPLKARAELHGKNISPGSNTSLNIYVEVAKEHKAYVDMFKVKWVHPAGVKASRITANPSFTFEDKFSKKIREGVKGSSTLSAVVEFPEDLDTQDTQGEIALTYQACTDTYCMFPKTILLPIDFKVVTDSAQMLPDHSPQEADATSFEKMLRQGWLQAYIFVFIAGLLTSLTPCVFPMIPITLAVIGARAAGTKKFKSFSLSLTYVFGIAFTYALLGLVAAKTGSLFGSYLGHPLVAIGIATLFVGLALSMFGLYDLEVPNIIKNKLLGGSTSSPSGYMGAFVTGLFAGVVASPCVGPVLVGLLTYVAESQNLFFGFTLLFVFALGLGQLFLLLGTFSGLLQRLPKSGPWMEFVKFLFGSTMLAAALYYLNPVISHRIWLGLSALTLVLVSSGFGAFATNPKSRLLQMKKATLIALFAMGLVLGAKAIWNPEVTSSQAHYQKLPWQSYSDELLELAKQEGKPVIIDFWADWCVACKEIEAFTLTDPSVRSESQRFILLKIDATTSTPQVERLKKMFSVVGLPTMIFISKDGQWRKELTVTGFEKAVPFLSKMKKL